MQNSTLQICSEHELRINFSTCIVVVIVAVAVLGVRH